MGQKVELCEEVTYTSLSTRDLWIKVLEKLEGFRTEETGMLRVKCLI